MLSTDRIKKSSQAMPVHKQVRRHRPSPGLQRRRLCETASLSCSHGSLSDDSNEGSSAPQQLSTKGNFAMGMMVKKVSYLWLLSPLK